MKIGDEVYAVVNERDEVHTDRAGCYCLFRQQEVAAIIVKLNPCLSPRVVKVRLQVPEPKKEV